MSTRLPTGRSLKDNVSRTYAHASEKDVGQLRLAPSWDCNRLFACPWLVLVVALGILWSVLIPSAAAAEPAAKNVLVLHNWASLPASWAIMESTVRARVPGQVNFYAASVENPRFDDDVYRESLAETLHRGYGGVKLDLVIASTYAVLQFAMEYRDEMFPGVPIVFT